MYIESNCERTRARNYTSERRLNNTCSWGLQTCVSHCAFRVRKSAPWQKACGIVTAKYHAVLMCLMWKKAERIVPFSSSYATAGQFAQPLHVTENLMNDPTNSIARPPWLQVKNKANSRESPSHASPLCSWPEAFVDPRWKTKTPEARHRNLAWVVLCSLHVKCHFPLGAPRTWTTERCTFQPRNPSHHPCFPIHVQWMHQTGFGVHLLNHRDNCSTRWTRTCTWKRTKHKRNWCYTWLLIDSTGAWSALGQHDFPLHM